MTINKITIAIVCLGIATILQAIKIELNHEEIKSLKSEIQNIAKIETSQEEKVIVDLPDGEMVTKKTTDGCMIGIDYYIVKDGELVEIKPN